PTVFNPSVFNQFPEQQHIDGATGALTQQLPLDIPPGRNGLQPNVSLSYNSQNATDGIVGYGWTLSTPYIQRLNKTGSQNLYNASTTQYFTSSIEGELAATTATVSGVAPTTTVTIFVLAVGG